MTLRKFACYLLMLLVTHVAASQACAQGKGGVLARRLPAKFQGLSNDQAREIGMLAELNIKWIGDIRETPGADPVVDLFGPYGGQRATTEDEMGNTIVVDENERGLIVLSGLSRPQMGSLLRIAMDLKPYLRDYYLARAKLISKIRRCRDREEKETAADARTFEKEVIELGKLMGEAEARVAVNQAWAYIGAEAAFAEEQKNYLRMLRENPDAFKLDSPAVKAARDLLQQLEEPYPILLQDTAAKLASFLGNTAETNAARRPHRSATLLGKASPRMPDDVPRFLETLTPAQQDRLLLLLNAERPFTSDYVKKRVEFLVALDGLKKVTTLQDKKFIAAGAQMGELEARIALAQARAFEQLRLSLAPAQLFFVEQNLVSGQ
ncbi:hypothetical protein ETAA8_34460 [Anatilimnocola aggregata]|uniref:Uncharacterized protein n=1 Tax=Anatilimnocola aggregata TaxID=2528021 RepID=A0A517YDM9_9BACT|nr:hypothetical protein [Anatilimnocola aggregata]QDU28346.1 hypothetical protein ETAA8_34460 [Anatilimnocola aggregata]